MAHDAQINFCKKVKSLLPQYFNRVNVIDVGSRDITDARGRSRYPSNRGLFRRSFYLGIDLEPGKNVDVVGRAHLVLPNLAPTINAAKALWNDNYKRIEVDQRFETIISTECLEHDAYFNLTLEAMYMKLRPGGLLLITCAGEGRPEHGTYEHDPGSSPSTNDYYCNVTRRMFAGVLTPGLFTVYHLAEIDTDLQFYGVKA